MANPGEDTPQDGSPDAERVLLDHAVRCWESEGENAARYERERRLLLTAILAIVGFGAYKLLPVGMGHGWLIGCLFWPFTIASVVAFIGSFVNVIQGRSTKTRDQPLGNETGVEDVTASFRLRLPADVVSGETLPSHADALRLARDRTYDAFIDLQERNAEVKARVRAAGSLFITALALALIAAMILLIGGWLSADMNTTPGKETGHVKQRITEAGQADAPDAAAGGVRHASIHPPVHAADGPAGAAERPDDPPTGE